MPDSDLLPSLLFKINENQLALEAAILELTIWVEQRGSAEVAANVRSALTTIDRNEEFIRMTLAILMTPESIRERVVNDATIGKTLPRTGITFPPDRNPRANGKPALNSRKRRL